MIESSGETSARSVWSFRVKPRGIKVKTYEFNNTEIYGGMKRREKLHNKARSDPRG